MKVRFYPPQDPTPEVLAEAEIVFDEADALAGLKLVGFTVRTSNRFTFVTLPSRAFGVGRDRAYFPYLRPDAKNPHDDTSAVVALKARILEEYEAWRAGDAGPI